MKDLYKTLGVAENADDATIKKAYRKLAKEFHPDVTGGDKKKTERFKEINEAYECSATSKKRAEYDRLKHAPVRPDGMPEGFDAEAFAQTFGGARAGAGGGVRDRAATSTSATSSPACSAAAGPAPASIRGARARAARPRRRRRAAAWR